MRKFPLFLFLLLLLIAQKDFAQGEYNNWHFGVNSSITFNGGSPVITTGSQIQTAEASASISDAQGNLLFYTNGSIVWNSNNIPMPNGSGLAGWGDVQQSVIIVPKPNSPGIYYVFTNGSTTGAENDLNYSIVDMSLNGGLGDVTQKNIFLDANETEKLIATRHSNGSDFWIIIKNLSTNQFKSFLLSQSGVNTAPVVSNGGVSIQDGDFTGAIRVSNNGCWLLSTTRGVFGNPAFVELFHFNNTTGVVSDGGATTAIPNPYGLEFSPDNSKFYVSENDFKPIQQFNLNAGSISQILASNIPVSDNMITFTMQAAPDGKIYFVRQTISDRNMLGAIENPNNSGVSCNVNPTEVIGNIYTTSCLPNNFNLLYQGVLSCATTTSTTADFSVPATICANTPINITNNSTNATNFYWNFCSGSLNLTPAGSNFPSANLSLPSFSDIVQEGLNFYVFVVNHTGSLSRMDFGNSLLNTPTITNLGSFGGIIPFQAEGIEIQQDGANWIGYIIGGQNANSRLLKLSFGTSVANTPTATNLGNIGGLSYPVDFTLIKDGGNWYGFTVSADNNTVTRYNFGNSLNNTPVAANLGNIGGLNYPVGLFILKDVNNYYLFVTNRNSHTISRLDFGTTVAGTPTGVNLGNPGNNFNWPRDITVIKDCDKIFGFVTNEGTNAITRLDFNNNLLSVPTTTDLGNVGNMNFPSSISEIFRTGDAVNFFSTNVNSNSISRITFNNCTASSIPSYSGQTPPPFQYSQPGVYNISLFVDEGLPTQSVLCKQIVVSNCSTNATASFDAPDTVCVNTPVNITNTSTSATTSYWNFCVGNINTTPTGTNLGNIGNQFQLPVFIDYVQYNGNYYGFVTNNLPGKLTRLDFGNSLLNTPTAVNLGNVGGIIPDDAEEIQLAFNEGRWYAIIVGGNATTGGSRIVKIDFGPDLTNTSPTGTNWGNIGGLNYPGPLHLFNDSGNWYAFTVDGNNDVTRFSFGSSFANPPTAVNFGNIGGFLNGSDGIYVITDNGQWYVFVSSRNNSSIIRLNFGNSLLNTPTATNLGNPNSKLNLPRDIYVIKFCGQLVGFVVNEGSNDIVKLNFTDLLSIPTAVSLGNIGNLSFPHSISKIFRVGSDLYSFILNVNNNTITRLNFAGCTNSNIPNYAGTDPPPVIYSTPGTYNINLTIDDGLPTQTSICKQVVVLPAPDIDFNYTVTMCDPFSVQFNATGASTQNAYWDFGDGNTIPGNLNPVHTYLSQNSYIVKYSASNGRCTDTVTKTINLAILTDDIIRTHDTTLCVGATKQLLTNPALSFCWSPTTYLNDPNSPNPITSPAQDITYYLAALTTGTNLIINSDFSQGNTGFTSQYTYTPPPNVLAAQYYVGTNPQVWNIGMTPCTDHTTGSGNMMLVNGSSVDNVTVWSETITVQPNTNYAFSTWIQDISGVSPAQLQFSINGVHIGAIFQASNTSCLWQQFYTTWNSGTNTSAVISIVNRNLILTGNDFALDDISFAPVFVKRDSVKITIDRPVVKTNQDTTGCAGIQVQLNTIGAANYSWLPPAGLSNTAISNPVATPLVTTQYVVSGVSASGCIAKDTVNITVNPKPVVNASSDASICKNSSLQLFASGGTIYSWTPTATLDDPTSVTPMASPSAYTVYYVTVTDANTCTNTDSVKISIRPDPVFTINLPLSICEKDTVQLTATGGTIYTWQADPSLSNTGIANPLASPPVTTTYTVDITETTCNNSTTLTTTINVNPRPVVKADKSNDIDCSNDHSQLNATGAATYTWSPVTSLNNPGISNPVASPTANTQYIVKGTDGSGCSNYDSVLVNFLAVNASGYFMPNVFTPNHDGLNDCYGIRYWGVIQHLEFSIYNRWGQRIFFTTDPGACWDGTFEGKMQDIGVYVYMIKAKTLCGDTFKKGLFTLAR